MSRRTCAILLGLAMMGLVGPHGPLHAQVASPDQNGRDQSGASDAGDTIFLQDENGEFQKAPLTSLQHDPNSRQPADAEGNEPAVPDFFFSKLQLDGIAHEDWIDLTASLTVHLVAADRWVAVPMRFDQGSLLDFKHAGPGDLSAPAERQRSRGLTWLLRGAGDHQLELMLRVPLRKTPTGDLLQLELPEMTLFTGKLTLQLPSSSVTIRTEETVRLLGTRIEGEHTILTAELPGERVDLRWNIHEPQTEPVMQKPTDVRLRLTEEKLELTARQQLQFGVSTSETLRVRLPSEDLQLTPDGVRMIDANGNETWIQPVPTDQPDWVSLPLGDLAGHPVQLTWSFSTPMPPEGREFVIDGFEVAEARRQSGTIAVESSEGFRVTQVGDDDIGVERIDVSDLPASSTLSSSQAYSFTGTQYRLRLRIEPTVPVISVTPYYFLKVSQDRVELEAIYQLSVDGGVVRTLPVVWSGADRGAWDVVASALSGGLPRKIRQVNADAEDAWELSLPEIIDNRVEVGISAVRYFDTYPPAETISLSLPALSETRGLSGWIIVSTDDDVEVSMRADESTVLTSQAGTALSSLKIPRPDWTNTQPLTPYRFSTNPAEAAPQLEMDLTVQSQTITTSTVIEVRDIDHQPRVRQRLSYDVQFGRQSHVRLKLPNLLSAQLPRQFSEASLTFLLDGEIPLTPQGSGTEVTLELPTPRLGRFEVVIDDYSPSLARGRLPSLVDVPIITDADQPFSSVRLMVPSPPTLSVDVRDTNWTRLHTVAGGMQWITDRPVDSVSIALDRSLEQSPQRIKIDKAFLQTVIDDAGHRVTHATYFISDSIDELVLQLPENAESASFKWNGIPLAGNHVLSRADDRQIRIKNPLTHSMRLSPQAVSLSYQSQGEAEHWSESQAVSFPEFAPGVWVEQMWWELKLPPSQHLFVPPSSLTAQFQWYRDGIFWKRMPVEDFEQFRASIHEIDGAHPVSSSTSGNDYLFVTVGSPTTVEFRTMSKSGIVFLGAGLTLFAGFLLLKVPAARHPVIWLAVCLAVLTLSLWYLEPLLLLLQPAAYGLIFPCCAALLDYVTSGQRHPARRSFNDSTYRESADLYGSGFNGTIEPPVTSTFVRPTAVSDSGINS